MVRNVQILTAGSEGFLVAGPFSMERSGRSGEADACLFPANYLV